MGLSTAAATDLLKLLFNNTTWAGMGDATGIVGSTGAGSLYIALHTADPTAAGNESSNEISYTGYARVAVARTTGGFTVATNTVSNAAAVTFPQCTGGAAQTATYFSIGKASSGATEILASGALASSLAISANITPSFAAGALTGTAT